MPYNSTDFEYLSNRPLPPLAPASPPPLPDGGGSLMSFPPLISNLPAAASGTQIVEGGVMTAYEAGTYTRPLISST